MLPECRRRHAGKYQAGRLILSPGARLPLPLANSLLAAAIDFPLGSRRARASRIQRSAASGGPIPFLPDSLVNDADKIASLN